MGYMVKERISRLEQSLDNWITVMFRHADKAEKLEKQIAELQCEVVGLRRLIQAQAKSSK